jgi:ATP-dependent Lhr-like helicase
VKIANRRIPAIIDLADAACRFARGERMWDAAPGWIRRARNGKRRTIVLEFSALDAALSFLNFLAPADDALANLSPATAAWFRAAFGAPTAIQRGAFPIVASGKSSLLSAPTGTGKTLAAFLPLLERLPAVLPEGMVGLIITPLKALAADQFKNVAQVVGAIAPQARLGVRTGDTPAAQRRKDKILPPHLLWTTPESLAILLTRDVFRRQAVSLRWVLIDEVHALAANKRGVDLSLSLERLETLTEHGRLQRIGLSATCEPLETVARFLIGAERPCHVVHVPHAAAFDLAIEPLPAGLEPGFVARVVERLLPELDVNRTTLIFANTRNVCERIGWALKRRLPQRADAIATHHSSLAPARRRDIERSLKDGKLAAVVSSASMELGIDIGSIDGVVFVNPPGGVGRLLQRLGRAGHRPGAVKRGLLLCSHPSEILEAAVTATSGRLRQLEPIVIPEAPLDVLCQQLVGMSIGQAWSRDAALALVRRAFPYRDLTDDDFDACIRYLQGRGPDGAEWLPARLDEVDGQLTVTSRRTAKLMGRNLGTIITEEPRLVRLEGDDGFIVGELDESYADVLQPGDRFLLDGRCLTLQREVGREMIVRETPGAPLAPHWASGSVRIPEELARRLYLARAEAAEILRDGPDALAHYLQCQLGVAPRACAELVDFLLAQEAVCEIPETNSMLIEVVDRGAAFEYALHTPLHSAGNEALARVLQRRLRAAFGGKVMIAAVTLGIALVHEVADPLGDEAWRRLLAVAGFEEEVGAIIRAGDLTRSRFFYIAQTGLMVLRQPLGGPRKVGGRHWIERRLFDQILAVDPEFALLRQARRETLAAACDGAAALKYLMSVAEMPVRVRCLAGPSPIAAAWLDVGEEAAHKQWHEAS